MLAGAHVPIEGGVSEAPARGADVRAETIQLFSRQKRRWFARPYTRKEVAAWKDNVAAAGLREIVVHGSYLVNLAATDPEVHKKSMLVFADEMARCQLLGIPYLNFHPGAHVGAGEKRGMEQVVQSIGKLLDDQPDNPTMLLVENTVHQGSVLGYTFEQCADIIDAVDDERMGQCIDTAHAFVAGYDHRTRAGYEGFLQTVDDTVGLERVRAFHLNDAQHGLGANIDRHENIGQGHIGVDLFRFLMNDPRFEGVPGNLETRKPEMWAAEVAKLKALREDGAPDATTGQ